MSALSSELLSDFLGRHADLETDPDTSNLLLQAASEAKQLEDILEAFQQREKRLREAAAPCVQILNEHGYHHRALTLHEALFPPARLLGDSQAEAEGT